MSTDKKNSFWLASNYIIAILSSFITLKLNITYFGVELFGIWILIFSFWGVGNVLDLGVGTAMIKFIAQSSDKNDKIESQKIILSGFVIFFLIGFLILIGGFFISSFIFFENEKIIPNSYSSLTEKIFTLLGLNFYIYYLFVFCKSVLEGMNNFIISSKLSILFNLLVLISVIIIIISKLDITYLAFGFLTSSTIILIIAFSIIHIKYNLLTFKISFFSIKIFIRIFRYSMFVQCASLAGVLVDPVIKYIIGNYSSISLIPVYEIARRFALSLSGLFNTTFKNILTKVSIVSQEGYINFLLNEASKLSKLGIIYSGLVYGILQIFVAIIIKLWFGFEEAVLLFLILSLPEAINNFGYSLYMFLLGTEKANFLALLQLFNLITTSACLLLGFVIFKNNLGFFGYLISVIIGNVFLVFYVSKTFSISWKKYLIITNIQKLFFLLLINLLSFLMIYFYQLDLFLGILFVSILNVFIFYSDLIKYSNTLLRIKF